MSCLVHIYGDFPLFNLLTTKKSWSKISCRINCVARVVTKANTNSQYCQTNEEWDSFFANFHVVLVSDGANAEQQDSSSHNLVTNSSPHGQVMTRIGAKYRRCIRCYPVVRDENEIKGTFTKPS